MSQPPTLGLSWIGTLRPLGAPWMAAHTAMETSLELSATTNAPTRPNRSRSGTSGLLVFLVVSAAALHFFRLSDPATVVFDEVHFGSYVNAYVDSGAYFFDIHPPHAKLLIAAITFSGGYRGEQSFEVIHAPIDRVSPTLLRFAPALAGTTLPLIVFGFLTLLGASRPAAGLGAFAVLLDNALLIQTRLIALDGILLSSTFGALAAFSMASKLDRTQSRARVRWLLVSGSAAGFAAGCKFIGLVALGMIALSWATNLVGQRAQRNLREALVDACWILVAACAVYLAGWALHFALLDQPGPGDAWGSPTGVFLTDLVHVHRQMLGAADGLTATHPYASRWWSWPLMLRPVSYWTSGTHHLHFLGNPVVWWGSSVGIAIVLVVPALLRWTDLSLGGRPAWPRGLWFPLCGYALAWLPLAVLTRVMFLYHYLMSLMFAICVVVLWADHVGWIREGRLRDQRLGYWVAVGALLLGFALVSPFTLAYVDAPQLQSAALAMFPGWR